MGFNLAEVEEKITAWAKGIKYGDYRLLHYKVYLFGSCVKGKENPGDIDVAVECIELKPGGSVGGALVLLRIDAHAELSPILGKVVNVEEYDNKYVEAKLLYDSRTA